MRRITLPLVLALTLGAVFTGGDAEAASCGTTSSASIPDFDGSGTGTIPDVAIGVPGAGAGSVEVRYNGSPTAAAIQLLAPPDGVTGDRFGSALSIAELNGDGCDDLLVGAPGRRARAGAVFAYLGTSEGLSYAGELTQDSPQAGAEFGAAVSGASHSRAVVGVPLLDVGGAVDAGGAADLTLTVANGEVTATGTVLTQGSGGIPDTPEAGDRFGASVAAAHRAIGAPGETVDGARGAGAVVYGTQFLTQNTPTIEGVPEAGDGFGSALTTGIGEGEALWIGVPGESVGTKAGAGMVNSWGYAPETSVGRSMGAWNQDSPGIAGAAEAGDGFGTALGVQIPEWGTGSWNLAIGIPGEDIGAVRDAGMVISLGSFRLALSQDVTAGTVGAGKRFGASLQVGQDRGLTDHPYVFVSAPGSSPSQPGSVLTWHQETSAWTREWRSSAPDAGERYAAALPTRAE